MKGPFLALDARIGPLILGACRGLLVLETRKLGLLGQEFAPAALGVVAPGGVVVVEQLGGP